jgi:hypothetical protein
MSPFAGEGANIAMLDGAKLAEAIADCVNYAAVSSVEIEREMGSDVAQSSTTHIHAHPCENQGPSSFFKSLDQTIRKFEKEMFERAHIAAAESDQNMRQFLGAEEDVEAIVAKWQELMHGGSEGH